MSALVAETNKQPGVCYAWTDETVQLPGGVVASLELPVIDLTHPAFDFHMSQDAMDQLIDQMVVSLERRAAAPPAVLEGMYQKSLLMRGMMVDSADTFTTGLMTYLNKLGPSNLGDGYAGPLDRQWAASLTPATFRLRMTDLVTLLADGLVESLKAQPGAPLHLVNIAGGPAADSLNTLIVLRKTHPALLDNRPIHLYVLDLDCEGPHFGERALAALMAEGGPLHGLAATFEAIAYDWHDTARLAQLMAQIDQQPGPAAVSSEGGLFEYACDEDILANLRMLSAAGPELMRVAGPVVRDASTLDERLKSTEHVKGRPTVRYMGLDRFGLLASAAGWVIDRCMDGPMHQVVSLRKA